MHQDVGKEHIKRNTLLAIGIIIFAWCLYGISTAPGTIYGDPSEYQFIPAIWGIAHPPGYAFYTILAGVWQRIFPLGTIAFRTNLMAGLAGAWTVSRACLIIIKLLSGSGNHRMTTVVVSLLVGAGLTISPDLWQHSIHANAHIISVALTSTQLWLLMCWSDTFNHRLLYTFAFFCGIGVSHHPITVWGLPAYAIYIAIKRPQILRQWRTLLLFILFGISGLIPWVYFVIRSPNVPFGPTDMRTLAGFIRHATAQGLRVNLFYYGLRDQLQRWAVFISLLRLQFATPFLLCMLFGIYLIIKKRIAEGYLILLFIIGHLVFTINSVQDVMAYLLHVFMALTIPLALGLAAVLEWWQKRSGQLGYRLSLTLIVLFISTQLFTRFSLISLREWDDADQNFTLLAQRFSDQNQGATYVADWEHLTPFYYYTLVDQVEFKANDIRPIYVTGDVSWEQAVFSHLPLGPVYLSNYRREIRDLGFRLRPVDEIWQVLEPPAYDAVDPEYTLKDTITGNGITILGYDLPRRTVSPGDVIPFTLYARSQITQSDILMPYIKMGSIEQRWTTDSRLLTPNWLPGEIIVEKYQIYIPHMPDVSAFDLTLHYANLTQGNTDVLFSSGEDDIDLGRITVQSGAVAKIDPRVLDHSLTVIGNEISLFKAQARSALQNRVGVWSEPLYHKQNKPLYLNLSWYVLKQPQMSYTVFIHLIDANGVPHFGHDYTPLGGAFPTYLWFPKWLPGQQVNDPYKLVIPNDVPPGQYWLEVGMYEMGSIRRIPLLDKQGSMTGDRFILGPVIIEAIDS